MADTKIDLRISEDLLEKVRKVAVERFDARIHHISKQPEVTYTINKLIQIGLDSLESGQYPDRHPIEQHSLDIEALVREQVDAAIAELKDRIEALENSRSSEDEADQQPVEPEQKKLDDGCLSLKEVIAELKEEGFDVTRRELMSRNVPEVVTTRYDKDDKTNRWRRKTETATTDQT